MAVRVLVTETRVICKVVTVRKDFSLFPNGFEIEGVLSSSLPGRLEWPA